MNVLDNATSLIMLRAILATAAAIVGGLIVVVLRDVNHRLLCALVSLAAGALLAVAALEILPEAAEMSSWPATLGGAAVGLFIFYLIGKYVYFLCPACAASAVRTCSGDEHDEACEVESINEQRGYMRLGILMIVAMTLHSLTDGMALALSQEALVGVLILIAVSYHKVPEGLALTSISVMAGHGRLKALLITIAVELSTTLGAFVGIIAIHGLPGRWVGIALAHIAGGFLYIVSFALVQEMREHERRSIVFYAIVGFTSIVVLSALIEPYIGVAH